MTIYKRLAASLMIVWATGLVAACSTLQDFRERDTIQRGLLTLDLAQDNFLSVWGSPTHTAAMSGDEVIQAGIGGESSLFLKATRVYEVWEYDPKNTMLVFFDHRLVAWKSTKTVDELSTFPFVRSPEDN